MYQVLATGAVTAAKKYSPAVIAKAKSVLAAATGGAVTDVKQIPKYVGGDAGRLAIAAGALSRAGFHVDDLVNVDLAGQDANLAKIRARLLGEAETLQTRFDSGADTHLSQSVEGDIIRKRRVAAALRVYGSEGTYFLCHPNGGIPRDDFAWYAAMFSKR